ncbi:MAG: hypothetical protein K5864_04115 [Bacteroidales bacterium]|nr:hypothetical protein [Bacteroidales bacterium]
MATTQKKKKDQFVIAYLADLDRTDVVISYSLFLADMINKGLILAHISDPRYTTTSTEQAEAKLQALRDRLATQYQQLSISYAALKGDTKELINAMPTLLGAVAIVAQVDAKAGRKSPLAKKSILKNFAECKVAWLVAQQPLADASALDNIAVSIDYSKESKEKMIWASYFARFHRSNLHVLYYDYKDEFIHKKWYSNMIFLHKFLTSVEVTFQPHIMESKSTFGDVNALRYAAAQGYGLLVSVTTKERDAVEYLLGVQEGRTIVNEYNIPILYLNPRDDLYVICD